MLDPVIYFFLFGLLFGVLKSPIRLPNQGYELISSYLLIAIGLKGGVELGQNSLLGLFPQILVVIALGLTLPLIAFPILKKWGKFDQANAASIAAHYGSVSVGTFAVGIAFLQNIGITFESHMPLFVVLLEVPAIIVGIGLAKGFDSDVDWKHLASEIFLGKSIVLLGIGLFVGALVGKKGLGGMEFFFFDMFKGILALFLMEMGAVTAEEVRSLKDRGLFLIAFGILMPLFAGTLGAGLGVSLGLSLGGATVLSILAASSSYIAVPAAMKISVPNANPSLSLGASLGVTFPFNVIIGIPLYYHMVKLLVS